MLYRFQKCAYFPRNHGKNKHNKEPQTDFLIKRIFILANDLMLSGRQRYAHQVRRHVVYRKRVPST